MLREDLILEYCDYELIDLKQILLEGTLSFTKRQMQVFLLHYFEDLETKEISQRLDISCSRVNQIHLCGIEKIKSCIRKKRKEEEGI